MPNTSLTLQALLKAAAARAGFGEPGSSLGGLSPAAKGFAIAGAAGGGSQVVVVPTDGDVDQMTADIRFFLGGMESLSSYDLGRSVLPFPSHEVDPYRGLAPHFEWHRLRDFSYPRFSDGKWTAS